MTNASPQQNGQSPLLTGDFYSGAYGPTLILIMSSPAAGVWLQHVFRELASGGPAFVLTAAPEVEITNLQTVEMTCRTGKPRITFTNDDEAEGKSFVWSATPDGWRYLVDLIQPLCDSKVGHQYLTEDKDDAAVIELSFGEQDVLSAVQPDP